MPQLVKLSGTETVLSFPDEMGEEDIAKAIQGNLEDLLPEGAPIRGGAPVPFAETGSGFGMLKAGPSPFGRLFSGTKQALLGPTREQQRVLEAQPSRPSTFEEKGLLGMLFKPTVTLPEMHRPESGLEMALSGGVPAIWNAILKPVAETLTSPGGWASLGAGRVGLGALAGAGAAQQPRAAEAAGEASVTGTPQQKLEADLGLAINTIFPALLGVGALRSKPPANLGLEGFTPTESRPPPQLEGQKLLESPAIDVESTIVKGGEDATRLRGNQSVLLAERVPTEGSQEARSASVEQQPGGEAQPSVGKEGQGEVAFPSSLVKGDWYHVSKRPFEGDVTPSGASSVGLASPFGAHFGTKEQVEALATSDITGEWPTGVRVGKYQLDVRKPYTVTDREANYPYVLAQKMFEDKMLTEGELEKISEHRTVTVTPGGFVNEDATFLKKRLQEHGYDALVYENEFEGGGTSDSIVPFEEKQIRNVLAPKQGGLGVAGAQERAAKAGGEVGAGGPPEWILRGVGALLGKTGFAPKAKVGGTQLYNRLKNLSAKGEVPPAELKAAEEAGLQKYLAQPRSGEEVAKWWEEKVGGVEVRKFGQRAKASSPEEAEFVTLTHEWLDVQPKKTRLGYLLRTKQTLANANAFANANANAFANANAYANADTYRRYRELFLAAKTPEQRAELQQTLSNEILAKEQETRQKFIAELGDKAKRYFELHDKYGGKAQEENKPHWQSIAPKAESEMPGYVELAVVRPTQRHDASKPYGEKFPSSHSFPSNTLGWVRGYNEEVKAWKNRKTGEISTIKSVQEGWDEIKAKIFHVVEMQSDWAQRVREEKSDPTARALVEERSNLQKTAGDSLLHDWERLALKAAIQHARAEGADAIALSDVETAMMTEGHDAAAGKKWSADVGEIKEKFPAPPTGFSIEPYDSPGPAASEKFTVAALVNLKTKEIVGRFSINPGGQAQPEKGNWHVLFKPYRGGQEDFGGYDPKINPRISSADIVSYIPQAKGMRLHYDTLGPRILEELTGKKGEVVEFGEHKMAFDEGATSVPGRPDIRTHRKDLIFPDPLGPGGKKVSITARAYSLKDVPKEFSLYGKDVAKGGELSAKEKEAQKEENVQKPGEVLGGMKVAEALRKAQEQGGEIGAFSLAPLKETWDKMRAFVRSGGPKERTAQLLDAADNSARILGRQEGNSLRTALKNKMDRNALTFVIEAGGDKAKLDTFATLVSTKNPLALQAIRRAKAAWAKLNPLATFATQRMDLQRAREHAAGIDTDHVEHYIKHAYEFERGILFDGGPGGTGVSSSFKKQRTFATYAAAIEAGLKPRNLDAADLVESRIAAGMKMVNRVKWGEALGVLKDPTDGELLVTKLKRQPKGTLVPPRGYQSREVLPGIRVAVKEEYVDIFDVLTTPSDIRKFALGRGLLWSEGLIKHGLLLFDTFHASRVLQKELFLTRRIGYNKGLSLLEHDDATIQKLLASNDISAKMAKWVHDNRGTADLLIKNGLNVGRLWEALYADVVRKELPIFGIDVNVVGRFNKWVFEKMSRGAMLESALIEFERTKANNPKWSQEDVAKHVAKQINVYFGNLQRQGILKSATKRDIAMLVALAPQWFESMVQTELRAYGQATKIPFVAAFERTLKVGTIAKGVGTGLLAYFFATQIINMFTRKHPTWENKEKGHKLDAWIPIGPEGIWLSPMSVAAEVTHDWMRYTHVKRNQLEVATQILHNKASPLERAAQVLLTQRDFLGRKTQSLGETAKAAAKALVPVPLAVGGLMSEVPGQGQRQLIGSAGLKVEPAQSSEQRLYGLAREFNEKKGVHEPGEFYRSPFETLNFAIRRKDKEGVEAAVKELLGDKSRRQIVEHYKEHVYSPFTGNKRREVAFRASLTPEERTLYYEVRKQRLARMHTILQAIASVRREQQPQQP